MARSVDATFSIVPVVYKYRFGVHAGVLLADAAADRDTAEAMEMAEHFGDDFVVDGARVRRGLFLISQGGSKARPVLRCSPSIVKLTCCTGTRKA